MQNDSQQESSVVGGQSVTAQKIKKVRLPANVKIALLLFTAASSLVLNFLPNLFRGHSSVTQPPFELFAVAGLIVIIFSAILFNYLFRAGLGLSKTTLIYAFGLSSCLVFIKLIIAPQAFYTSASRLSIDTTLATDPNSPIYYLLMALVMFLLYALVFRLIYRHFYREQRVKTPKQESRKGVKRILVTLLLVAAVIFGGGIIMFLPLLTYASSSDYLTRVISTAGVILIVAVAAAIFCAVKGFRETKKEVIQTSNVALWTSFFWLGLSLILVYHIMWIVLMAAVVHLWPLQTTSSK